MRCLLLLLLLSTTAIAQEKENPYSDPVPVASPYYRVRYEASTKEGELQFPVTYTMWLPEGVDKLRGVIVHQHGCGVGSCRSGQTGAFDLHWQALAQKHGCALLSPVYEQPEAANCQLWCDPRNGSSDAFQKGLADFAKQTGHTELTSVPWAIWGHSGGGHWCGGMVLLHPEKVAAAWLRSGVPLFEEKEGRNIVAYENVPAAALGVPVMCNLGTQEGYSVKEGRFSGVWPGVQAFFGKMREEGGLVSVSVDPLTSHQCGNQRYLAIPWLDACLTLRLPKESGRPLNELDESEGLLVALPMPGSEIESPVAAKRFAGDKSKSIWLPTNEIAQAWVQYMQNTEVTDNTPPPAPTQVKVEGNVITWDAAADLESGLASFTIMRDGKPIATLPEKSRNPFGRSIFQGLQYSDTPIQPLVEMKYLDETAESGKSYKYEVIAENTVGLKSK
ncbi:hypothetical protein C5Y96_24165 [Blastopirellula marina]|uniref:Esterase PHB depolymerase n=1 Tax=Blastopirellula marina TaxID=124 RepID=A0A2S8EZV5_9BACT|nr:MULTISPECIES: hypothetical protein [Pirellulaceae]PQO25440.1 hypothetical protein C5Y96_24165 [Blastopirellula marina]RCS42404.1 hypothetical protein DTL36_24215 [Bremerella cremea]